MLALRLAVVTIVGLYTSRIVLSTLGVVDFGVYSVAGSLVGVMAFLNTTMAGATNRFLCVEMGRNNINSLSSVFSSAMMIHIGIALLVLLISETIGVWVINNKLNIPADRLFAANCVFQCSIISIMIGITQTPYSAVILAREKMNIYAYFELLNVVLKLIIIALLIVLPGDKLIIYSILVTIVSVTMQMINRLYCIKHFPESKFKWHYDNKYFPQIFKYSLTDLYGNICIIGYEQTRPLILNIFFGVVYNAAASLAYTVQNMVSGFAATINQAYKPQVFKLYAQNKLIDMQNSMENALKFSALVYAVLSIPCIFETPYVLHLWLGSYPLYTILFLRIILATTFISSLSGVCCIAIHATGQIKGLTYITGSLYIAIPVITWICFKHDGAAWWLFAIYGIALFCITFVDIFLVKYNIPQFNINHFVKSILLVYIVIIISAIPNVLIYTSLTPSFIRLLVSIITYFSTLSIMAWFIILNKENRIFIKMKILSKIESLH